MYLFSVVAFFFFSKSLILQFNCGFLVLSPKIYVLTSFPRDSELTNGLEAVEVRMQYSRNCFGERIYQNLA